MKHTKGPWEHIIVMNESAVRGERNGKPCLIASCLYDEDNEGEIGELDANARLIASAPDLLEALKSMVEYRGAHDPITEKAREAISKAEER